MRHSRLGNLRYEFVNGRGKRRVTPQTVGLRLLPSTPFNTDEHHYSLNRAASKMEIPIIFKKGNSDHFLAAAGAMTTILPSRDRLCRFPGGACPRSTVNCDWRELLRQFPIGGTAPRSTVKCDEPTVNCSGMAVSALSLRIRSASQNESR